MSDLKKEQKYAWGKAPKAGKGVGRKPLSDTEKKQSVSISIRLPCEIVAEHGINGQWLWCAVMEKAKISESERFKPINNNKSDECHMKIESVRSFFTQEDAKKSKCIKCANNQGGARYGIIGDCALTQEVAIEILGINCEDYKPYRKLRTDKKS